MSRDPRQPEVTPGRRAGTLLACAGYVVVLAIAAIGADRVIAMRVFEDPAEFVPAYRSYQDPATGVKMRQLAELDEPPELLVIGNSRALFGVDPFELQQALDRDGLELEAFNAALHTVDVRFWPPFFSDHYEHSLPAHVLLNVIPRDLDRRNAVAAQALQAFAASPGSENGDRSWAWRTAEEALAQLYTLRGRVNETRRIGVGGLLRAEKVVRPEVEVANPRGWARFDEERALGERALLGNRARYANRHGAIRLEPGRDQLGALDRLARMVDDWGGCLTLFTVPTFYDRERWGTIEVRRQFEAEMAKFTDEHPGVAFLDLDGRLGRQFGPQVFGDGDHLNERGATRFSHDLADAIRNRVSGSVCAGLS